jgi:ribose 1,5-bisphosphokinase PhnN
VLEDVVVPLGARVDHGTQAVDDHTGRLLLSAAADAIQLYGQRVLAGLTTADEILAAAGRTVGRDQVDNTALRLARDANDWSAVAELHGPKPLTAVGEDGDGFRMA